MIKRAEIRGVDPLIHWQQAHAGRAVCGDIHKSGLGGQGDDPTPHSFAH
jgi:hypothetical protein